MTRVGHWEAGTCTRKALVQFAMPVDFLTNEQEQRYGPSMGVPLEAQLAQFFSLDACDQTLIGQRRDDLSRLGSAVMCSGPWRWCLRTP